MMPSCWWIVVDWLEPERSDVLMARTWAKAKMVREEVRPLVGRGALSGVSIYDGAGDMVWRAQDDIQHAFTGELLSMLEPRAQGRYRWVKDGVWTLTDEAPHPLLSSIVYEAGEQRTTNVFLDGKRACAACGNPGWRQTFPTPGS